MKEKNGFSLMELLLVMTILAILVVLIYPGILNSLNNAKKSSFVTDAKRVASESWKKYTESSMKNRKLSQITTDDDTNMQLSNDSLKYCVHLDDNGMIDIKVTNGIYYAEGKKDFTKEVNNENIKFGSFTNFSCDYELVDTDLREEVVIKSIKTDEKYNLAFKILLGLFVVFVVGSLFSKRNMNR